MTQFRLLPQDYEQMAAMNINEKQIAEQLHMFEKGPIPVNLMRPAVAGDGIVVFNDDDVKELAKFYANRVSSYKIIKFIPASGAASRMFHTLLHFYHNLPDIDGRKIQENSFIEDPEYAFLQRFLIGLREKHFAFYRDLSAVLSRDGLHLDTLLEQGNVKTVLEYLLTAKGLNYNFLPKALIQFHDYPDYPRTALEEHLVEGLSYICNPNGQVHIHLTVSPESEAEMIEFLKSVLPRYQHSGISFNIEISLQKVSSNTIAVDDNNHLFRDRNQRMVLRPGGHGALIENLSELNADVVFIKNIDNVVPDRLKEDTITYKKVLGGYLLKLREEISKYLRLLAAGPGHIKTDKLEEIVSFAHRQLNIVLTSQEQLLTPAEKFKLLTQLLDRPLRVCGMVKNQGEPGGGPFWVRDKQGRSTLQIIEAVQIDKNNPQNKQMLAASTHFNPVDLVCCLKNYLGNPFDLKKFVDRDAYFISIKSMEGKTLKALELPGLWNGAMADWITVFVEVPIITFNPIKTVNDLLRKEHLHE